MGSSHEDPAQTGGATAGQAITIPPMATPTIAPPLVPSPTTSPADPINSPDLRLEDKLPNSQPSPILNVAQNPVDPKSRPDPSEGTLSTENNQSDDDGTQASRPVAPLIYLSGEKVAEGARPTTIGGKVVVYTSGFVYVDDKIQLVPTTIPQAHPGTTFDVDGLHVEIKAPSLPEKPDDDDDDDDDDGTQAPSPVAPLIYISGERVTEGATPTTIGGKAVIYSSGSIYR